MSNFSLQSITSKSSEVTSYQTANSIFSDDESSYLLKKEDFDTVITTISSDKSQKTLLKKLLKKLKNVLKLNKQEESKKVYNEYEITPKLEKLAIEIHNQSPRSYKLEEMLQEWRSQPDTYNQYGDAFTIVAQEIRENNNQTNFMLDLANLHDIDEGDEFSDDDGFDYNILWKKSQVYKFVKALHA